MEGADVNPLPWPRLEREDKLFAEGDNVPFILPRINMMYTLELIQRLKVHTRVIVEITLFLFMDNS